MNSIFVSRIKISINDKKIFCGVSRMARVKVDTNYNSLAGNILPVNLDTLYWRVYIYCDDYLKKQTDIPFSYHDITSRYFSTMWKDCFQNKIGHDKKYIFPLNYSIISEKLLIQINIFIEQEFKMFLYDQKNTDINNKLSNAMKFGTIAIQVKQLMLSSKVNDLTIPENLNDNNLIDWSINGYNRKVPDFAVWIFLSEVG